MKYLGNTTFSSNYKYIITVLCFLSSFNVVTILQIAKEITDVSVVLLSLAQAETAVHWGPQQCRVGWDLRTGPIRLRGDQEKLGGGGGIARWMGSKPCVRRGLGRDSISLSL